MNLGVGFSAALRDTSLPVSCPPGARGCHPGRLEGCESRRPRGPGQRPERSWFVPVRFAHSVFLDDFLATGRGDQAPQLEFTQLPFSHPLFIMFSSGTTGVPKCLVHSAGVGLCPRAPTRPRGAPSPHTAPSQLTQAAHGVCVRVCVGGIAVSGAAAEPSPETGGCCSQPGAAASAAWAFPPHPASPARLQLAWPVGRRKRRILLRPCRCRLLPSLRRGDPPKWRRLTLSNSFPDVA